MISYDTVKKVQPGDMTHDEEALMYIHKYLEMQLKTNRKYRIRGYTLQFLLRVLIQSFKESKGVSVRQINELRGHLRNSFEAGDE